MKEKINIAIVGVTGLVGSLFLKELEKSKIEIGELKLFASKRSQGKKIKFRNQMFFVDEIKEDSFIGIDYVFFFANSTISKKYGEIAEKTSLVIDNSSFFRMQKDISLIVPEININEVRLSKRRIIANPNCSTIQSCLVLNLIKKFYRIRKIVYSTYQSVSGSGQKGVFDYYSCLDGFNNEFYPFNITKSCIPIIGELKDRYSEEEIKMSQETQKILGSKIDIVATCIRVPIINCHGISIYLETEEDIDIELLEKEFKNSEYIIYHQDNFSGEEVTNINKVSVGRLRKGNQNNSLLLYCFADNLLIGAAGNALKIVDYLLQEKM